MFGLATGQPEIVAGGAALSATGVASTNLGNMSVAGGRSTRAASKGKGKKARKQFEKFTSSGLQFVASTA